MIRNEGLEKKLNAYVEAILNSKNPNPVQPKKDNMEQKPTPVVKNNEQPVKKNSDTLFSTSLELFSIILQVMAYGYAIKLLFNYDFNLLQMGAVGYATYLTLGFIHKLFNK